MISRGSALVTPPSSAGRALLPLFLLAGALSASTPPVPPQAPGTAPALNWVLPLFTDKEGPNIAVTDLNIVIFSGDAAARVDSILLSRQAEFRPKENRASGTDAVRFIRDDIEVTGVGWDYDHAARRIVLHSRVRVTFKSQLNDILK